MPELSKEPYVVKYHRWRNKVFGYKVTVLSTLTHKGPAGYYTVLLLALDGKGQRRVSADRFLQDFRPIRSSRVITKSKYKTLHEDPFS